MTTSKSLLEERKEAQENAKLTPEEIENLVKLREKTEPYRQLVDSAFWEAIEKDLKDDLYDNIIFNEDALKATIGIKRVIERVKWAAKSYVEAGKTLQERG